MNFIPNSFMYKINNGACKIREKDNSYCFIKPACNCEDNRTIRTNNKETERQSLHNGTLNIFMKFYSHVNSISKCKIIPQVIIRGFRGTKNEASSPSQGLL